MITGPLHSNEWDWIIAYGLILTGKTDMVFLRRHTRVNFPKFMHRCRKCGKEYYSLCPSCEYRNGGEITGREDITPDLCDEFNGLLGTWHREKLANQLAWMRVPSPHRRA